MDLLFSLNIGMGLFLLFTKLPIFNGESLISRLLGVLSIGLLPFFVYVSYQVIQELPL